MNLKQALLNAHQKGYRIIDGIIYNPNNKILTGTIDHKGYKVFAPTKTDKVYVHRLVAYQKYGDIIFNDEIEVRHRDGIPLNNIDENILIGDHSRNQMDIPKEIRMRRAIHASSFLKKYNNEEIIKFYNDCRSYKQTMENFGISSKGTLHYILNNR